MCSETPRAELTLGMVPSAAVTARAFIRNHACGVHDGKFLDDALLLVTEIVTNAVLHGSPPLSITAECCEDATEIRVRDGSVVRPQPRHAAMDDEDGRGLVLLDSIADSWGVGPLPAGGKEVWFQLRHASAR